MNAVEFPLVATEACKRIKQDQFVQIWQSAGRRFFRRRQREVTPTLAVNRTDANSFRNYARRLLHENAIRPGDVAMLEWYQLCEHEGRGMQRAERIGIQVVGHQGATLIDVQPMSAPFVNEWGKVTLVPSDPAFGTRIDAITYPSTDAEARDHPIRQVLSVPQNAGFVALRGGEMIVNVEHLL